MAYSQRFLPGYGGYPRKLLCARLLGLFSLGQEAFMFFDDLRGPASESE
jgi:hypothetical protein